MFLFYPVTRPQHVVLPLVIDLKQKYGPSISSIPIYGKIIHREHNSSFSYLSMAARLLDWWERKFCLPFFRWKRQSSTIFEEIIGELTKSTELVLDKSDHVH